MTTPPNLEEAQSTISPPKFNGQYYGWWKTMMFDFIMTKDSELMDIILYGPHVPVREVKEGDVTRMVVKRRREFNDEDRKKVEKNYKATKIAIKQALANWGDYSSEFDEDEKSTNVSMLVVDEEKVTFYSLFVFMSNTEDVEEIAISETKQHVSKLKFENISLVSQLEKVDASDRKGKKEASRFQVELKEKWEDSLRHLTNALKKNEEL
ncbi:hypothetical protein FXO38_30972 [Capsicum annuum]|nr:hypothetical protein FXO38_30972 [Capsicum annuum]KAF3628349.1 hypothetical protein FXO37_29407 [Capsicum annuum]